MRLRTSICLVLILLVAGCAKKPIEDELAGRYTLTSSAVLPSGSDAPRLMEAPKDIEGTMILLSDGSMSQSIAFHGEIAKTLPGVYLSGTWRVLGTERKIKFVSTSGLNTNQTSIVDFDWADPVLKTTISAGAFVETDTWTKAKQG